MKSLANFNKLVNSYSAEVDFLIVYMGEAHAKDGWAIADNVDIMNHKSLEDRVDAANTLVEIGSPVCPVLVDTMDDCAQIQYSAFPERLFVVLDGKIVYHGNQGPFGHKVEEVDEWLKKYRKEE